MAMYKVEILPPALKELYEIADYYLQMVGPISANNITDRILVALERLEEFPLSCPYLQDAELKNQEYRMLVCDKYVCIYRLIGSTVFVYHIAHGSIEYGMLLK